MFVAVQTVRKGDTIRETYLDGKRRLQVEKGPGTKVTKVEHSACSKRGTHINSRECFDFGSLVWRTVEVEADTLVEWDIDNNIPVSDPRSPLNPADEIRDYALYDMALSTTGLGEILTVDGKAYLNAENARTEVHLGELFPDPWAQTIALQQRLVAEGVVDSGERGLQLMNDLRSQGARRR